MKYIVFGRTESGDEFAYIFDCEKEGDALRTEIDVALSVAMPEEYEAFGKSAVSYSILVAQDHVLECPTSEDYDAYNDLEVF